MPVRRSERVVVEQDDLAGVGGQQLLGDMGADLARASGDQELTAFDFHVSSSPGVIAHRRGHITPGRVTGTAYRRTARAARFIVKA